MNWRTIISQSYDDQVHRPGIATRPEFVDGISPTQITDAEKSLKTIFPASLKSLYLESNGVMEMLAIDGGEWFASYRLLWSFEEMIDGNSQDRQVARGKNSLIDLSQHLFFAAAAVDGIEFAFPIELGICKPCVIARYPIEDQLREIAPSLEDFVRGWIEGGITV
jgi:hypothetical protein